MPDDAPTTPRKRGPKTPEGKARSSMNALKHGLRSKRFLLLPEEDAQDFSSLVTDVRAAYGPEDAVEVAHVEAIAVAMWREIRADRIETEVMMGNQPGMKGHAHGTDLYGHEERASLTTALRYRTHAQMETKRATELFWRHRKARLADLLELQPVEEIPAFVMETSASCTNEFPAGEAPAPNVPAPAAAAEASCTNEFEPAPVTAETPCTNEFEGRDPPETEQPEHSTVTLLSTYRALKRRSVGDAWAWLNELTPEEMERLKNAVANELGRPLDGAGSPELPGAG